MTKDRVLIIGAGINGSAIAYFAAQRGLSVTVIDRGLPASGTSSRCEGNILLSDKELGPELDLARYSLSIWQGELAEYSDLWEFENKGGMIVSSHEQSYRSLKKLTETQASFGVDSQMLDAKGAREVEPYLRPDVTGAAFYDQDCQVQPMLAAAHLLRLATQAGAKVKVRTEVTGFIRSGDRICGVETSDGPIYGEHVVNATGTWASAVAAAAGVIVPVMPRRGFVIVTEPLPPRVFHKVYAAEYVENVGSSDAGLQSSPVVEGTPSGTILIGSSRERVGFSEAPSPQALKMISTNAIELFPFLSQVKALRYYYGFRPYCPDHLPVIGHDSRAPGLWHACGHEGAGIGLSVGTGKLIAQAMNDEKTDLPLEPFNPARFEEEDKEVAPAESLPGAAVISTHDMRKEERMDPGA